MLQTKLNSRTCFLKNASVAKWIRSLINRQYGRLLSYLAERNKWDIDGRDMVNKVTSFHFQCVEWLWLWTKTNDTGYGLQLSSSQKFSPIPKNDIESNKTKISNCFFWHDCHGTFFNILIMFFLYTYVFVFFFHCSNVYWFQVISAKLSAIFNVIIFVILL